MVENLNPSRVLRDTDLRLRKLLLQQQSGSVNINDVTGQPILREFAEQPAHLGPNQRRLLTNSSFDRTESAGPLATILPCDKSMTFGLDSATNSTSCVIITTAFPCEYSWRMKFRNRSFCW